MLSDFDIAKVCFALYSDDPIGDRWSRLWPHNGGFVALQRVEDVDIVIWRGSETSLDWLDDIDFAPTSHLELGEVHSGFLQGVSAVWDEVDAVLRPNVIVAGHSLGAAHALLHAARLTVRHRKPERVVVCGSPRPGFQYVANILHGVPHASYLNRSDPVTAVPPTLPKWPYVQSYDLIKLDVAPSFGDAWGLLADHHWQLYLQGIEALCVKG